MKFIDTLRTSDIGVLARREYWRHRGKKSFEKIDDYTCVCNIYRDRTGRELDLKNPKRYYEKLNWMKLFYRPEIISRCTDKHTVREYLSEQGYTHLLNEQYAAYKTVDEFFDGLDSLPDKFVVKASHGSGWNLIVKNKSKVNWFIWRKIMNSWMKQNASWFGREWNYATDDPRLVVERYLEDETGQLRDYKFFCFDGVPQFVMLEESRYSDHKRVFCDCEGNILNMNDKFGLKPETTAQISDNPLWKEMFSYAALLSKPFPHVRVDFFICNQKVYFGEMTFYNDSGFAVFEPDDWDYIWGEKITLPEPNYNLELLNKIKTDSIK